MYVFSEQYVRKPVKTPYLINYVLRGASIFSLTANYILNNNFGFCLQFSSLLIILILSIKIFTLIQQ